MNLELLKELSQAYKTAVLAKFEALKTDIDNDDNYVYPKAVREAAQLAVKEAEAAYDKEIARLLASGLTPDDARQLQQFHATAKRYL